jgi:TRAP-type C4-dicarboxylate transport system substrate-binding protein
MIAALSRRWAKVKFAKVLQSSVLVAVLLTVAACTFEGPPDEPTQAATEASVAARVLRLGTQEAGNVPTRVQMEEFVRQVEERSGGRLVIQPVFNAGGDEVRGWDQAVARKAISGELEMAVVPSRAWDTEGVLSFRALSAPFLVSSDTVIKKAVEPALADGMLAGLTGTGVTGLALFPEGQRMLFSFKEPILTPADVSGKVIRAPRSETTYAALTALGGLPDDLPDNEFGEKVDAGLVAGAESSLAYASNLPTALTLAGHAIATGNLVLSSKFNTLVINSKIMEGLEGQDRQVLRDAAGATRNWAIGLVPSLAVVAKKYCQDGGKVVLATPSQASAFRAATAAVYTELEKDAGTRALIATLRELAANAPPDAPVEACDFDTY